MKPQSEVKRMNSSEKNGRPIGTSWQKLGHDVRRDARRWRHWRHPVEAHFHGPDAPLGVRAANRITGFMGSWLFLWLQTIVVLIWIALNVIVWLKHFDPYPFILLNLAFSTQAAYAAPLILMAGNVAAARDRELWENDYQTNQNAFAKIEALEEQVRALVEQNTAMMRQNQELLELFIAQNDFAAENSI